MSTSTLILGNGPWPLSALVSGMVWVHAIWPRAKLSQWQCCQLNGVEDLVQMSSWNLSPGTAEFISIVTPWVFSLRGNWIALTLSTSVQWPWWEPDHMETPRWWMSKSRMVWFWSRTPLQNLMSQTQPKPQYKTHHSHLLSWKSLFLTLIPLWFTIISHFYST